MPKKTYFILFSAKFLYSRFPTFSSQSKPSHILQFFINIFERICVKDAFICRFCFRDALYFCTSAFLKVSENLKGNFSCLQVFQKMNEKYAEIFPMGQIKNKGTLLH